MHKNRLIILFFIICIACTGCFGSNSNSSEQYEMMTITLDKNGGNGGTSHIKIPKIKGKTSAMPPAIAPTKEGFDFKGYYINQEGNGQQYYSSSMSSYRNWNLNSDKTLYARWLPNNIFYEEINLNSSNFADYFENDVATGDAYWYSFRPRNEHISLYTVDSISFTFIVDVYEGYNNKISKTYSIDILLSTSNTFATGRVQVFKNTDFSNKTIFYDTKIINVSGILRY